MKNTRILQHSFGRLLALFMITATMVLAASLPTLAQSGKIKNVVLVHGAFADGSGWKAVYDILTKKGYKVSIVQNPLTSLKDDVEATNSVLDAQDGPIILVGHSWGGAVITESGANPKVAGLVYVAAFVPEVGESAGKLASALPAAPEAGLTAPDKNGLVFYQADKFHKGFAADLSKSESDFMSASQVPIKAESFGTPISIAAWKNKPSWGIVATNDKSLHPDTERMMYKRAGSKVTEIKSSHVVYISHPMEVAKIIEEACNQKQ